MKIRRRKSMRLKGYDYSQPGFYFVTKCSKYGECFFGTIILGKFKPSPEGLIVIECWNDIPIHYPNVVLHAFTLMPNHFHGIIEITPTNCRSSIHKQGSEFAYYPLLPKHQRRLNRYQHIIPRSLGCIMRGFEIGVTKRFRTNTNIKDVWHRNFYETIIRFEKAYKRITKYIENNPQNWTRDEFYF